MSFSCRTTRRLVRIASVAAACTALPALAQANGACAPVFAAHNRLYDMPYHAVSIDSAGTDKALHGGKPKLAEMVLTGGVFYVQYKGKWMKSPLTLDAMKKQEAENIRNSKSTCTFVRNESVNGESAALYTIHSVNDVATSDGEVWISKSRGVPLRSTVSMDVGGGSAGKSRVITNYDFTHVQKPAVAQ